MCHGNLYNQPFSVGNNFVPSCILCIFPEKILQISKISLTVVYYYFLLQLLFQEFIVPYDMVQWIVHTTF